MSPRPDVIVVGGGSAGCVLAARLTEDPDRQVLLLEAGPDYPTVDTLPDELSDGYGPTNDHDWGYRSEPDARGNSSDLPRAKVMGGCSMTNAACTLRGAPADYDGWAAQGNPGWSFADLLPYFRKLETDADFGSDPWHGSSGPLPIRRYRPQELTPWSAAAIEAAVTDGHQRVDDLNAPDAVGVGPMPTNTVNGVRMSTSLTYLADARERPNLEIRPNITVDRVVIEHGQAVGVRLPESGEVLSADRIVLAAGAYASPAILLRSGIGPSDDLDALDIDTIADLTGVGRNLIEHPNVICAVPIKPVGGPRYQVIGTWRSRHAPDGFSFDMHLVFGRSGAPVPASPTNAVGFVSAAVMKPKSRGWLQLRSTDPDDPPLISLGFFTDPDDLLRITEGVRRARQLLRSEALREVAVGPELWPGSDVGDTDDALREFALDSVATYHHPVGTCAMGPDPDAGAVVDTHGSVHGIDGLTVADASIMPDIPAANTNVPTIMLAERIADWLRATQGSHMSEGHLPSGPSR